MEELFADFRAGVEAVFMQGPTVQLEALATRLHATKPHLDELVSPHCSIPSCPSLHDGVPPCFKWGASVDDL